MNLLHFFIVSLVAVLIAKAIVLNFPEFGKKAF